MSKVLPALLNNIDDPHTLLVALRSLDGILSATKEKRAERLAHPGSGVPKEVLCEQGIFVPPPLPPLPQ